MCEVMCQGSADKVIAYAGVKDAKKVYECKMFFVYKMSEKSLAKVFDAASNSKKYLSEDEDYLITDTQGYLYDGIWRIDNFKVAGDTMRGYVPDDNIKGLIKPDDENNPEYKEMEKNFYTSKKYDDFFDYAQTVLGESEALGIFTVAARLAKKNKMGVGAFLQRFAPQPKPQE